MRAVIFDLDGTLIDAAPDIAGTLNRTLIAFGHAPLELAQVRGMIGDGAKILLERGFAARGAVPTPEQLQFFLDDYAANPVTDTVIYDGIIPALEALQAQNRPLGICTNKPMKVTTQVLDILGLTKYFGAVVGGDSMPYRKPDPRHLAAALSALEVSDAIMVGDHENDMKAAAGLGLPGVLCGYGYGAGHEIKADAIVQAPSELPAAIARLG